MIGLKGAPTLNLGIRDSLPAPAVIIGPAEIIDLICISKWGVLGLGEI